MLNMQVKKKKTQRYNYLRTPINNNNFVFSQLSAYVKRGCSSAKILIELYSEPSNYIITRTFTLDNKNQWSINGENTSLKQVTYLYIL